MSAADDIVRTLWVIYDHPIDFPYWFVVRRQFLMGPPPHMIVPDSYAILRETLDQARSEVPRGLRCIGRHAKDDPCIVESWCDPELVWLRP